MLPIGCNALCVLSRMYLLLFEALLYNEWGLNLMCYVRPVCVNTFREIMAAQSTVCAWILPNWGWKEMPEVREELQLFADQQLKPECTWF